MNRLALLSRRQGVMHLCTFVLELRWDVDLGVRWAPAKA